MKDRLNGGKTLIALSLFVAGTLAQIPLASAAADRPDKVAVKSAAETPAGNNTYRPTLERPIKNHREGARVSAAITATPAIYASAQTALAPEGARGGLKGWVLLLMGAFLIATISQRRYQALSDI